MESEFGNGRAPAFCRPASGWGSHDRGVPGVRFSRKTGYKIFDRYREHGLEALSDRSRRPVRYANQLPQQLETLIVRLKSAFGDSAIGAASGQLVHCPVIRQAAPP